MSKEAFQDGIIRGISSSGNAGDNVLIINYFTLLEHGQKTLEHYAVKKGIQRYMFNLNKN